MLETVTFLISSAITNWIAFLAVAFSLLYWYSHHQLSYFKKRGIPGPKPWPFIGNIDAMVSEPMCERQMKFAKQYGPVYGMYFSLKKALIIAEPELIKQILVKDFHKFIDRFVFKFNDKTWDCMLLMSSGDDWKRVRALTSPTFSSGKIKKMYLMVAECTKLLEDEIYNITTKGSEIDLKKLFGNLTMDVICRCAFAIKTNTHKDSDNVLVKNALHFFNFTLLDKMRVAAYMTLPFLKAFGFTMFKPALLKQFRYLIKEIIAQRESQVIKDGKKPNDFLQLMLNSRNQDFNDDKDNITAVESAEKHYGSNEESVVSLNQIKQPLSEDELLAQCFVIIIAGYETTATLLSYLFHSLALNPECQEKLFQEIEANENERGEIEYETLAQMPYLDACISETLRHYDPLCQLERTAVEDTTLGDFSVPKGMTIQVPIYAIHHDEKFYPQPFKFNPDRFLPENRHNLVPYTYLPFGAGPRNCIGLRFALVEAKLATVKVLKKFKFTPNRKTSVPLQFKSIATNPLLQTYDIIVNVERRTQ